MSFKRGNLTGHCLIILMQQTLPAIRWEVAEHLQIGKESKQNIQEQLDKLKQVLR